MIVISAGDAIFAKFHKKLQKHKMAHFKVYGMLYFFYNSGTELGLGLGWGWVGVWWVI